MGYKERTRSGHRFLRQLEGWLFVDAGVGLLCAWGHEWMAVLILFIFGVAGTGLHVLLTPTYVRNFSNMGTSNIAPGRNQRESDAMARRKNRNS